MRSLYLRDVPSEVIERLERLAALEGVSVNELRIRDLTEACRVGDQAVLDALPDRAIVPSAVLRAVAVERSSR